MRQLILDAHRAGAISTFSWHLGNPLTGKGYQDTTPAMSACLPGARAHDAYRARLDEVADFLDSLHDDAGRPIPILLRPFHEQNGDWFWWCTIYGSQRDYIALWRYTVHYLRHQRGLHQLILVWSPDAGKLLDPADYLAAYPGDDVVDVFGLDIYAKSLADATPQIRAMTTAAESRDKLAAITEFGYPPWAWPLDVEPGGPGAASSVRATRCTPTRTACLLQPCLLRFLSPRRAVARSRASRLRRGVQLCAFVERHVWALLPQAGVQAPRTSEVPWRILRPPLPAVVVRHAGNSQRVAGSLQHSTPG